MENIRYYFFFVFKYVNMFKKTTTVNENESIVLGKHSERTRKHGEQINIWYELRVGPAISRMT